MATADQSEAIYASGLVISSWRSESSLDDYLASKNVVAIAEVDTRQLPRVLREKGAQGGIVACANSGGRCAGNESRWNLSVQWSG